MIIGHRGAPAAEPENTLESFEAAIAVGADGVEFDVRLTSDGHAVVIHDADVGRTTDGVGLVRGMTLPALKRLRIRTPDDRLIRVPTLDETLALLSGRTFVDIEIKNIPGQPDFDAEGEPSVVAVLASLDRVGFSGGVMLTSFNPFSLARARELDPTTVTGLLLDTDVDPSDALSFAREAGHRWLLPHTDRVRDAGSRFVDAAHAAGVEIGVWLTDDPAEAQALFALGVDAVATNDPAALVGPRRQRSG